MQQLTPNGINSFKQNRPCLITADLSELGIPFEPGSALRSNPTTSAQRVSNSSLGRFCHQWDGLLGAPSKGQDLRGSRAPLY